MKYKLRAQFAANIDSMRKTDKRVVVTLCRQLSESGHSTYSIAKTTGVPYSTVRGWLRK